MNREQRRKMMRKKSYRDIVRKQADQQMRKLEEAFKKKWENDEDLNDGDIDLSYSFDEDEVYD